MAVVGAVIPSPPERLTGNVKDDVEILHAYLIDFYQALIPGALLQQRMDDVASVDQNSIIAISNPPTQNEVNAVRSAVLAILNAAAATGAE